MKAPVIATEAKRVTQKCWAARAPTIETSYFATSSFEDVHLIIAW
jgi:hypothetical protein